MGGVSKQKSESSGQAKTAAQTQRLDEALAIYGPLLGQGANLFQADRVTPFSALQERATAGAANFADLFSTPQAVGTPLFQETGAALTGALGGTSGAAAFTPEDTENFFNRAIRDPQIKGFQEQVLPSIAESFAGPGFFGAARSQAQTKAATDLASNLGSQRAALEFDVLGRNQQLREAAADRAVGAVSPALAFGQVPAQEVRNNLQIASDQLAGLSDIFGFGQAEQTQAQAELQDEILRFAEENAVTDPENLSILMALLGLNFSTSSSEASRFSINVQ